MKKLIYLLLFFLALNFTGCIKSKDAKKEDSNRSISYAYLGELTPEQNEVKDALIEYLDALKRFDSDSIVAQTYPKLFNVIDETHFKEYITIMSNSKDIFIKNYETNITEIGPVITFNNGTQFSQIEYTSNTEIILINPNLYNTDTSINFLYDVLIHKYGKENIDIDVKERSLKIKKEQKLIAIKDEQNDWKFIGDNQEYRQLYPSILPSEVLSHLK